MTRTLISAAALALAMGLPAPATAQDLSIGGMMVPADQMEAVQSRCNELLAADGTKAAADPNATVPATDPNATPATDPNAAAPAAEAPAAGASTSTATTESAAEEPVDPAVAAAPEGNMAADANADGATTIDLETLTAELCREGGFTASAN